MKSSNTVLKKCFASIVAAVVLCFCYFGSIKNTVYADYNQGIVTFVTSLYSDCLGRTPDATGLDDWCSKLASGQISGKQAAYGFFFSPEFQTNANSMTDDEFIDAYYKVFLNRAADPSGKSYWTGQIAGTTNDISILFTGFADSTEFADKCASYGITAGPHINVPTTVRGASGGGSGGGSRLANLQSAAENALAAARTAASAHGWTITESYVVRATESQYGIYFRAETPCSNYDGQPSRTEGIIKAEYDSSNNIILYDSQVPLGGNYDCIDYDNYSDMGRMSSPASYYEETFSFI